MWQYNYTGMDSSSDELQHWKYISRHKDSKGKWRYVYADKSTHKKIEAQEALNEFRKTGISKHDNSASNAHEISSHMIDGYDKRIADSNYYSNKRQADMLRRQYAKTQYERDKTITTNLVSSIPKKIIDSAKEWLSKLFS